MPLENPQRLEGGRRLREGARTQPPLVSIVTVVFRAAHELPLLLESILANRDHDTEWIVIDGGSDDGTLEILRRYDDAIDYWISESDRGIYDAMNKGIAAATGKFVLHINAGDRLLCIPREELHRCLDEGVDIACFTVKMAGWGEYRPKLFGLLQRIDNIWHHQGQFYRRSIHPGYDLRYRVYSDFDCNQKLVKAGKTVAVFRKVVAEMYTVGASGSGPNKEKLRIVRTNYGIHYVALAVLWHSAAFVALRYRLKHVMTWLEHRGK
jgi:glycosyltransferase involved in cell wall biosynthesis